LHSFLGRREVWAWKSEQFLLLESKQDIRVRWTKQCTGISEDTEGNGCRWNKSCRSGSFNSLVTLRFLTGQLFYFLLMF